MQDVLSIEAHIFREFSDDLFKLDELLKLVMFHLPRRTCFALITLMGRRRAAIASLMFVHDGILLQFFNHLIDNFLDSSYPAERQLDLHIQELPYYGLELRIVNSVQRLDNPKFFVQNVILWNVRLRWSMVLLIA